jgi:hypothetical protein
METIIMQGTRPLQQRQIPGCFLFVFGILLLVSCTPTTSLSSADNATATVGNDPGDVLTPIITEAFAETATATGTLAPTKTPVSPTLTPYLTMTNTPFPEPTPTMNREQRAATLAKLMTENGGCELPCWWGVVPGETSLEIIPNWFVPQGFERVQKLDQLFIVLQREGMVWREGGRQLHALGSGSSISVEFDSANDTIQSIKVHGGNESEGFVQDWERYGLDQVLTRYGIPSQVLVYHPWPAHAGEPTYYHLLLFYEELGIQIDYLGVTQYPVGGKITVCPDFSNVEVISLFLYQPGKIDNVVERVLPLHKVDIVVTSGTVYDLIQWEQTVGTSIESFYETFKDSQSDSCFEFNMYTR